LLEKKEKKNETQQLLQMPPQIFLTPQNSVLAQRPVAQGI
jgi:hypothetical protein